MIGMTRSPTATSIRRGSALEALDRLGTSPSDSAVLTVHCAAGHHVGALYRTPDGLVWAGIPHAHSHGGRDFVDAAHHGGHRDSPWVDWVSSGRYLGGGVDAVRPGDPLPAGCECGPRSLSRLRLLEAVAAGDHRLILD